MAMKFSFVAVASALLSFVTIIVIGSKLVVGTAASSSSEESAQSQLQPLRVQFVNELPDASIELYWENPEADLDDPDRRRFEATIPPRGGSVDDTLPERG